MPSSHLSVRKQRRAGQVLSAALSGAAVVAIAIGLISVLREPAAVAPFAWRWAVVAVATAVAHVAVLRLRLGSVVLNVCWGEAAIIVGLHLLPWELLVSATAVGAGIAWWLQARGDPGRSRRHGRHVAAVVAATAAIAGVVALVSPTVGAPWTPELAVVLALAAAALHLASTAARTASAAIWHRRRYWLLTMRAVHGASLTLVGNTVAGLAAVAILAREPRWLPLLAPVLWLLHQTYAHRLRAGDERRAWRALAEATSRLNQLDEAEVARAGLRGAREIFGAAWVELDVRRPYGLWRRYVDGHQPAAATGGSSVTRRLTGAGGEVAWLRMFRPAEADSAARDELLLGALGDALAAALDNAASQRRLRMVEARSTYAEQHDPLTGLINWAALLAEGDTALRRLPADEPVGLLLLDVNDFKEVNDTLGHAAGDELLRVVAGRLRRLTRQGELLARLGGDEFAMLVAPSDSAPEPVCALDLPGLPERDRAAPRAVALRRARQIAEELAVPVEVAGVALSVEASVGVVIASAGTATMTELVRRADRAMYQAKSGGGSVGWYDSARDAASTNQLALLAELRAALAVDDQLVLALQPAVDLKTGDATGVEALIRWKHPRRGPLAPGEFISVIESSDLLAPFTQYVIDRALATAADWALNGLLVPISVNVSARSLLDPRLPADVAELLRRHQVPAHRLVLEITETVMMSELAVIDEVLAGLRATGVQLAVDDFGTGFSSMTLLTRVPVDELKVDREFVAGMVDSPEAAAIVRTTVDLARELGLRVVAEGVETADQRAALTALGCTSAQGYHFFRPMPPEKVLGVLRALRDNAQARIVPLRADGVS
ncbi:bifunctional diguanylate cyclase/phosphodiesterase [Pilimelia columellifera]|uniref:Diguanylate cyclase/phosphodiesterase n=1 Tax=Pilimelia columellifera subsp. columellifera TaxID=706583 RepID=A0ABP6AW80_9ACTN